MLLKLAEKKVLTFFWDSLYNGSRVFDIKHYFKTHNWIKNILGKIWEKVKLWHNLIVSPTTCYHKCLVLNSIHICSKYKNNLILKPVPYCYRLLTHSAWLIHILHLRSIILLYFGLHTQSYSTASSFRYCTFIFIFVSSFRHYAFILIFVFKTIFTNSK